MMNIFLHLSEVFFMSNDQLIKKNTNRLSDSNNKVYLQPPNFLLLLPETKQVRKCSCVSFCCVCVFKVSTEVISV